MRDSTRYSIAVNKRAPSDALDELHALQASALMSQLKRYLNHVDEEGNPAPLEIPPALFAQVTKFLKDNGIDSPARAQKLHDALRGALPDLDDVETEHMGHA